MSSDEETTGRPIAPTTKGKQYTFEEREQADAPPGDVLATDLTKVDGPESVVDNHTAVGAGSRFTITSPEAGHIGQTEAPLPTSVFPPEEDEAPPPSLYSSCLPAPRSEQQPKNSHPPSNSMTY